MDNIIVEDTNIFIDLLSIDLLEICFRLPVRIHTTEFSINELSEKQQSIVLEFVDQDKLCLKEFSAREVSQIEEHKSMQTNNVSFTDCSVWLYAKWNGYRLVTGDKKLRRSAEQDGVVVSGILLFVRPVGQTRAAYSTGSSRKVICFVCAEPPSS